LGGEKEEEGKVADSERRPRFLGRSEANLTIDTTSERIISSQTKKVRDGGRNLLRQLGDKKGIFIHERLGFGTSEGSARREKKIGYGGEVGCLLEKGGGRKIRTSHQVVGRL